MPGIVCSVHHPAEADAQRHWQQGLELLRHHPEHVQETFSEPGFHLACVYHPAVCKGPRLLVTETHVLAVYGNLFDDDLQGADGEALCHALLDRFLRGGAERLQHLNGRYDVAVWDRRARVLHWVGDRFGANRHYCHHRPGALHIACEVKALAPWLDAIKVDPAGLASMLTFGYHIGDLTILEGVKCLPNARRLVYRAGEDALRLDRYWNYPYGEAEPLQGSEDELAEALHAHLTTALKRQLRGVDKILLPISGGLDSRTMAELLHQSGFDGEVMAYSFGQTTSRDVRYGRAIARKLGYPHVHIPTPADFITRHMEPAAWHFDAEWPADLNWARYIHTQPALGKLQGYTTLSGFMGDAILGSDRYNYRRKAGDSPLGIEKLADIFYACVRDMPIDGLLEVNAGNEAEDRIAAIARETFTPLTTLAPFYALLRSELIHRQRRHTGTVTQSLEPDFPAISPFLDPGVVDFSTRIPYALFHGKRLYKRMIRRHLPKVAAVPYANTGLPLADAPIRQAVKWRFDNLMKHFPRLQHAIQRRNKFFDYRDGVLSQANYYRSQIEMLGSLSPPLIQEAAARRMEDLLNGRARSLEQASALLPPAIFMRELRQRLKT